MMGRTFEKTIVVSASGVREGGRLELLRQCLQVLSQMAADGKTRVVAFVSDQELCPFPHVEYKVQVDDKHLYRESVLISEQDDKPIDLWLSLFDATPHVESARQAVFCCNPFPWLQLRPRDWMMDRRVPKAVYAARSAYRRNVRRNDYLIVQHDFFRRQLARLTRFDGKKIITFPSTANVTAPDKKEMPARSAYTFFCPSTPDCYKNFEIVCEAARLLELEIGRRRFRVECTIRGEDNKYGWWLKSNWDHVDSVHFAGWQSPAKLWGWYEAADCLVYPSRCEAWGRPISEFATTGKPMLLVDLPYARETAAGSPKTAFFPVHDAVALKEKMKALVLGDESVLSLAPYRPMDDPKVYDWPSLFRLLLSDND
ncbi:MAG: glycosyltransferase [Bacteroidales bacterium]|nr:glycosyltransferase [Bacteroidales bacterium]